MLSDTIEKASRGLDAKVGSILTIVLPGRGNFGSSSLIPSALKKILQSLAESATEGKVLRLIQGRSQIPHVGNGYFRGHHNAPHRETTCPE